MLVVLRHGVLRGADGRQFLRLTRILWLGMQAKAIWQQRKKPPKRLVCH
jgi:hypothetical protein